MENFNVKKIIPYVLAILAFAVISLIYFSPALEGKKLKQGDIDRFKGMSKEITDHNIINVPVKTHSGPTACSRACRHILSRCNSTETFLRK